MEYRILHRRRRQQERTGIRGAGTARMVALREFAYGYGFLDVNRSTSGRDAEDDPWNPPSPHGRLVGDVAVYKARY